MESCLAFSTKPQVLTTTTSAPSPSVVTCQPSACSRAASSSESTSLRAQPRVSRATRRPSAWSAGEGEVADTIRGYRAGRGSPRTRAASTPGVRLVTDPAASAGSGAARWTLTPSTRRVHGRTCAVTTSPSRHSAAICAGRTQARSLSLCPSSMTRWWLMILPGPSSEACRCQTWCQSTSPLTVVGADRSSSTRTRRYTARASSANPSRTMPSVTGPRSVSRVTRPTTARPRRGTSCPPPRRTSSQKTGDHRPGDHPSRRLPVPGEPARIADVDLPPSASVRRPEPPVVGHAEIDQR